MNTEYDIMDTPEADRVKAIIEKARHSNLEREARRLVYQIQAAAKEEDRPYRLDLLKKKRLFRNK